MRCLICGTYMGTLSNGACGVCAERYPHHAPSEVEQLRAEVDTLKHKVTSLQTENENLKLELARLFAVCADQAAILAAKEE